MLCSYNRLNGPHLSEHPILKDTLRGEWGFKGLVREESLSASRLVADAEKRRL